MHLGKLIEQKQFNVSIRQEQTPEIDYQQFEQKSI